MNFEPEKTYFLNTSHGYSVKVTDRTNCFVTLSGYFTGKKKVYRGGIFGDNEYIMVPAKECKGYSYFCVSDADSFLVNRFSR